MAPQPDFPSPGPEPGGFDTQPRGTHGSCLLLSLSLDCILLSPGGDKPALWWPLGFSEPRVCQGHMFLKGLQTPGHMQLEQPRPDL